MKAYETYITSDELIGQLPQSMDYLDAFSIQIPSTYQIGGVAMVRLFFDSIPWWTKALLGIREWTVRWIGLKTTQDVDLAKELAQFEGKPGDSIGLFQVLGRSEQELMTGESDKHLDFWLSFIGRPSEEAFEMKLATAVVFHGWLGRWYFAPVKPLHRIIVPAVLNRMALHLVARPQDYQ